MERPLRGYLRAPLPLTGNQRATICIYIIKGYTRRAAVDRRLHLGALRRSEVRVWCWPRVIHMALLAANARPCARRGGCFGHPNGRVRHYMTCCVGTAQLTPFGPCFVACALQMCVVIRSLRVSCLMMCIVRSYVMSDVKEL